MFVCKQASKNLALQSMYTVEYTEVTARSVLYPARHDRSCSTCSTVAQGNAVPSYEHQSIDQSIHYPKDLYYYRTFLVQARYHTTHPPINRQCEMQEGQHQALEEGGRREVTQHAWGMQKGVRLVNFYLTGALFTPKRCPVSNRQDSSPIRAFGLVSLASSKGDKLKVREIGRGFFLSGGVKFLAKYKNSKVRQVCGGPNVTLRLLVVNLRQSISYFTSGRVSGPAHKLL